MKEGLIRVMPDKEKVKSIIKMVNITIELIGTIDAAKFPSHMIKEYYDVIRELLSAILLLDGYKTQGEGAHKKLIEYVEKHYPSFKEYEVALMEELRITRNKIAYDGFFVTSDYLSRNIEAINLIVAKLKATVDKKLK